MGIIHLVLYEIPQVPNDVYILIKLLNRTESEDYSLQETLLY